MNLDNYRGDSIHPPLVIQHSKQFAPVVQAAIVTAIGSGLSAAFAPDAPEQRDSRVTEQEKRIMRISAQLNKIRQGRAARERGPMVANAATLLSTPGHPQDAEQQIDAGAQLQKGLNINGQPLNNTSGTNQSQPSRQNFSTSQPGTRRHNNPSRFVGADTLPPPSDGEGSQAETDLLAGMDQGGGDENIVPGAPIDRSGVSVDRNAPPPDDNAGGRVDGGTTGQGPGWDALPEAEYFRWINDVMADDDFRSAQDSDFRHPDGSPDTRGLLAVVVPEARRRYEESLKGDDTDG